MSKSIKYEIKTKSGSIYEITLVINGIFIKNYTWYIKDKHNEIQEIVALFNEDKNEITIANKIKRIKDFKNMMILYNPKMNTPKTIKRMIDIPETLALMKHLRCRTSKVIKTRLVEDIKFAA